jgi:hypothetical protein
VTWDVSYQFSAFSIPFTMNPTDKKISQAEEDRFDRLVDGELSESERRALLTSLDARPEGWRRCALAFLEAQTWRESLGEMTPPVREPSVLPAASPVVLPRSPRGKKTLGALGTVLAMSACFLVALGLGAWALRGTHGGKTGISTMNSLANNEVPPIAVQSQTTDPFPGTVSPVNPSPPNSWKLVQVKAPGLTGNNEPLQLPAVERDRLDDEFFNAVPNPLPDDILQALKRTGNDVRMRRELVPMLLPDGRRLIVPVDQVEVRYEGNQSY